MISPVLSEEGEYSAEERQVLLRAAHEAIEAALNGQPVPAEAPSAHLAEPRGVFTSLYLNHELRGCVGFIAAVHPVYRTVVESAIAAAFYDNRFPPVSAAEARQLKVQLSVLSALFPIRAEEVEVGRHGLLVSQGGFRGLLLPQVPVEHGWDRVHFLEQTCIKAGLGPDAWKKGATLEGFTAEVFGER